MNDTLKMVICQDSREARGLDSELANVSDCVVETGVTLPVFDYCLRLPNGDLDPFAVERKGLGDFISSITTTNGQRLEQAKIARAVMTPVVYVIEARLVDILPRRICDCIHLRASSRCRTCHGAGFPWCDCVKERPTLKCSWCGGIGAVGHDYGRRKITPQFTHHMVSQMIYEWRAVPVFCGTREGAACMIHALLKRRWEWLKVEGLSDDSKETP